MLSQITEVELFFYLNYELTFFISPILVKQMVHGSGLHFLPAQSSDSPALKG